MTIRFLFLLFSAGFCGATLSAWAQSVPSFSGADGAGANATGGRGGLVYHVTRLDGNEINANSPGRGNVPGSLAYGVNDNNFKVNGVVQPRTIIFDVGGTFWLGQKTPTGGLPPTEGWDTQDPLSIGSNITIAGQTAPGGVYIMGGGLKVNGTNSIIRNVTIAPGYGTRALNSTTGYADSYVYDGMNIATTNAMIDHVTIVFATDEALSADERASNVTVQYSNISQGQNYPQADAENPGTYSGHALGSLLQAGSNAPISIHHNLYAHQKGRLPRVGTETSKLTVSGVGAFNDFRNNVFYNWLGTSGSGASGQPSANNFVGNFWRAGPGGDDVSGTNIVNASGGTSIFSGSNSTGTKVYHTSNLKDTNKDGDANDGVALSNSDFGSSSFQANPQWYMGIPTYNGVTDTATIAYNRVLSYAGANWNSRDAIDTRIFNETATGTGKIMAFNDPTHGTEWNALLNLRPASLGGIGGVGTYSRDVNWDTDTDGMPDSWEVMHGLQPAVVDNNGDFDADGFTNLDEYINEISEWPAPQPVVFNAATNSRFAQITNWDVNPDASIDSVWQPSKYDTAQIKSGTAVVDSVGQHARILQVAPTAGNNATLSISGGWIDIAQKLEVGAAGSGVVEHASGLVVTPEVVLGGAVGASGVFNLSGGDLSTVLLRKGDNGGVFNFTGGVLHADTVAFDLVNEGGTLAPGHSLGTTQILGDLTLNDGTLEIEIGGAAFGQYDRVEVEGSAILGGALSIKLIDLGNGPYIPQLDDEFVILEAQLGVDGLVDLLAPPTLSPGLAWSINRGNDALLLTVIAAPILAGDYNADGTVDAADYVVWRNNVGGASLPNETESVGVVDQADYNAWQANFGATYGSGSSLGASVPEPTTTTMLLLASFMMATCPMNRNRIG